MSFDPNTAVILYQPIDFQTLAFNEIEKAIGHKKASLDKLGKNLHEYRPQTHCTWNGKNIIVSYNCKLLDRVGIGAINTETTINHIADIRDSTQRIAESLKEATRGFETKFASEIAAVNRQISSIFKTCATYLESHLEMLNVLSRV